MLGPTRTDGRRGPITTKPRNLVTFIGAHVVARLPPMPANGADTSTLRVQTGADGVATSARKLLGPHRVRNRREVPSIVCLETRGLMLHLLARPGQGKTTTRRTSQCFACSHSGRLPTS